MRALIGGCWIGEAWGALTGWMRTGHAISGLGHEWHEDQVVPSASVSVLSCQRCGEKSVSWRALEDRGE